MKLEIITLSRLLWWRNKFYCHRPSNYRWCSVEFDGSADYIDFLAKDLAIDSLGVTVEVGLKLLALPMK